MLYCAHNLTEDSHLAITAQSIEEAGNIAADYWMAESSIVVVMSLEAYIMQHGGCIEIL